MTLPPRQSELPQSTSTASFLESSPALAEPGAATGRQMSSEHPTQTSVPLGSCQTKPAGGRAQAWGNTRHHPLPGKPATLALLPIQIIFKVCCVAWNKLVALEANPAHYYLGLITSPSFEPSKLLDVYKGIYSAQVFSFLPSLTIALCLHQALSP